MRVDNPQINGTIYYTGLFLTYPSIVHTFFQCTVDQNLLDSDISISASENGFQMILIDTLFFENLVEDLPICNEADEISEDLDNVIELNLQHGQDCIEYIAYFTKIIPFIMPYDQSIKAKIGHDIYDKLRDIEKWCDDYKEHSSNKYLEEHSHDWTPF